MLKNLKNIFIYIYIYIYISEGIFSKVMGTIKIFLKIEK